MDIIDSDQEPAQSDEANPLVVGVGSSAGGLEALSLFLEHIEERHHIVIVIAQHLSPQHQSLLSDLLGRTTEMEVAEVTNGMAYEPGHVYVTPPNHDIEIRDNRLVLSPPHLARGPKPSVDMFFESLARECGTRCMGIVLSGTGSDGTRGVKAIKAMGGSIIVQEPSSAKYDGMPNTAIRTGCADLVLKPEQMIEAIVTIEGAKDRINTDDDSLIDDVLMHIRQYTHINFLEYKRGTIRRRIDARMAAERKFTLAEYSRFIRGNAEEAHKLQRDILISVTNFFRDAEAFDVLKAQISKQLDDHNGEKGTYRVWVPGCATGEEAYSLAMILADIRATLKVQIFATDLDESALDEARKGLYTEAAVQDVPRHMLDRHFEDVGHGFQIKRQIRDMIVFANHNLTQDPPFLHLDLVSCRNLLIYFQPELQKRALRNFHHSLDENGLLFLGKSEHIGNEKPSLFSELNRQHRVFEVRSNIPAVIEPTLSVRTELKPKRSETKPPELVENDYLREALMTEFVPPAVLVDKSHAVIKSVGNVRRYLSLGPGNPDFSILGLVPERLSLNLRTLLYRAEKEDGTLQGQEEKLVVEGEPVSVRLDVRALMQKSEKTFLVTFHESPGHGDEERSTSEQSSDYVTSLETELDSVKMHLQTVIEELETSNEELQSLNEELQSSNEELQASNEELQASNEEMESSNEELQSTNEELLTVNAELEQKSTILQAALTDIDNIQNSGGEPLAVVDSNLHVRRINEWMTEEFGIPNQVIGQPLRLLDLNVGISDLTERIYTVMATEQTYIREITQNGKHYRLKIRPYYEDSKVDGAVLIFHDISELTAAFSALETSETQFRHLIEGSSQGVLIRNGGKVLFANESFGGIFGLKDDREVYGLNDCMSLFVTKDGSAALEESFAKSSKLESTQIECVSADHKRLTLMVTQRPVKWHGEDAKQMVILDVTEQVNAETHLRNAQRVELLGQLTGGVAHDFNNLMAVVQGYADLIRLQEKDHTASAESILMAVQRGKELVDRLLSYARKQKLKPVVTELNSWLRSEAPLLQRALGTDWFIELDLVAKDLTCFVDVGELETSILNLLLNARDAMKDGGTIRIETFIDEIKVEDRDVDNLEAGRYVRLSIIDSGSGMSEETKLRAFEPFYTTKPVGEGSGLGLASVFGFARQSGGDAAIESTSGFGTRISLWLPSTTSEFVDNRSQKISATQSISGGEPQKMKGTVLGIDDDAAVNKMVENLCRQLDLNVLTALNASEALNIVELNQLDVVLSDVSLGEAVSGIELLEQILKVQPQLKVVVMSGLQNQPAEVSERGYEYLGKPFRFNQLADALSNVLVS